MLVIVARMNMCSLQTKGRVIYAGALDLFVHGHPQKHSYMSCEIVERYSALTTKSPFGIMCIHPSTDVSVVISTDTRPICRSTYRPILDRYVGRHIDRHSVDSSAAEQRRYPCSSPRFSELLCINPVWSI